MTPTNSYVLVEPSVVKHTGRLVTTDIEKSEFAIVVAVGPNVKEIQVGDKVFYKNYMVDTIKDGGVEYTLLDECDIKMYSRGSDIQY